MAALGSITTDMRVSPALIRHKVRRPAQLPEAIDGTQAALWPMFRRGCAFITTDFADFSRRACQISNVFAQIVKFNLCARSTLGLLIFGHEHSSLPVRVIDREIRESLV
jgi:hypothetical protein